jgi:putative tryptophan/tyrosine transport system substrate-binding protein
MRRRDLVRGFAGLSAAWPLLARAQQRSPMQRHVGMLWYTGTDRPTQDRWTAALRQGLEQLGWSEGHNLLLDIRYAAFEQLRQSAKELVAGNPDVLIATSTPTLTALRPATSTIPIVFVQVTDPVGQGFVASLANPAGNITGFMNFESAMAGKWVELLLELSPNLAGIAVIANTKENPQTEYYIPSIEAAAKERSLQSLVVRFENDAEFDRAVVTLQGKTNFGLIAPPGAIKSKIVDAMDRLRMPAVYWTPIYANFGGLATYGTDSVDDFRRAASYIDRILRGARVSELPVQAPTKFELVINLKTARALGITVPATLLVRADAVIE